MQQHLPHIREILHSDILLSSTKAGRKPPKTFKTLKFYFLQMSVFQRLVGNQKSEYVL